VAKSKRLERGEGMPLAQDVAPVATTSAFAQEAPTIACETGKLATSVLLERSAVGRRALVAHTATDLHSTAEAAYVSAALRSAAGSTGLPLQNTNCR